MKKHFEFQNLDLHVNPATLSLLRAVRVHCPECKRNVAIICRHCNKLLLKETCEAAGQPYEKFIIPEIVLPIQTTVIMSGLEDIDSSSIPLGSTLPVSNMKLIHVLDQIPEVEPDSVLLMPGPQSKPVEEIDWKKVKNIYALDSKWSQCVGLLRRSPELDKLPKVQLSTYTTQFWRPHGRKFEGCLSTLECVYYMNKEIEAMGFNGQNLDDLLTLFVFTMLVVKREMCARGDQMLMKGRKSAKQYENWEEVKTLLEKKWGPWNDRLSPDTRHRKQE